MIPISSELSLLPIQIKDHSKLFQLMEVVYKTAYQHFWTDQGDWYLELCYNTENLKKELSRERSHYFFVEFQNKIVGILKYDFPFSPREVTIPNAMKLHRLYLDSSVHGKGDPAHHLRTGGHRDARGRAQPAAMSGLADDRGNERRFCLRPVARSGWAGDACHARRGL